MFDFARIFLSPQLQLTNRHESTFPIKLDIALGMRMLN